MFLWHWKGKVISCKIGQPSFHSDVVIHSDEMHLSLIMVHNLLLINPFKTSKIISAWLSSDLLSMMKRQALITWTRYLTGNVMNYHWDLRLLFVNSTHKWQSKCSSATWSGVDKQRMVCNECTKMSMVYAQLANNGNLKSPLPKYIFMMTIVWDVYSNTLHGSNCKYNLIRSG